MQNRKPPKHRAVSHPLRLGFASSARSGRIRRQGNNGASEESKGGKPKGRIARRFASAARAEYLALDVERFRVGDCTLFVPKPIGTLVNGDGCSLRAMKLEPLVLIATHLVPSTYDTDEIKCPSIRTPWPHRSQSENHWPKLYSSMISIL